MFSFGRGRRGVEPEEGCLVFGRSHLDNSSQWVGRRQLEEVVGRSSEMEEGHWTCRSQEVGRSWLEQLAVVLVNRAHE